MQKARKDTIPVVDADSGNIKWTEMLPDSVTIARYALTDTIGADFNGDGAIDRAFFEITSGKRNLYILEGRTNRKVQVGKNQSESDHDFEWVSFWGITHDTITYEIIVTDGEISGDREVGLLYPSIVTRKDEVGGGIITYQNGNYIWVHQAD